MPGVSMKMLHKDEFPGSSSAFSATMRAIAQPTTGTSMQG
jgi:hypothetical protein